MKCSVTTVFPFPALTVCGLLIILDHIIADAWIQRVASTYETKHVWKRIIALETPILPTAIRSLFVPCFSIWMVPWLNADRRRTVRFLPAPYVRTG